MYYPLYNNPFYYPYGAYMNNMCSYNYVPKYNNTISNNYSVTSSESTAETQQNNYDRTVYENPTNLGNLGNLFSIDQDRIEVLGISINIDDLIVLIVLFFMFREEQIDYGIIIILALILFDQS